MIEYQVRIVETGGAANAEDTCNSLAKNGWRLVSTAAANDGGLRVFVHLFFEREVETHDRLEDAVATMDAGERRELMDVAVAQAETEKSQ